MCRFLKLAIPRTLIAHETRPPLLIFTDAALECDDTVGTIGAVMIDRDLAYPAKQFFADKLIKDQLHALRDFSEKIITTLEVLPAAMALKHWSQRALHRRVFVFIDNDGARFSLINMCSRSEKISRLLKHIAFLHAVLPCFVWYARVPSASNIADAPSRFDFSWLRENGFSRVTASLKQALDA